MKYLKLLLAAITFSIISLVNSQGIDRNMLPAYFLKQYAQKTDIKQLPVPNLQKLRHEDSERDARGLNPRVGVSIPVHLDMKSAGSWTALDDGGRLWRLTVEAKGSLAISIYYDRFFIPKGGRLFIYGRNMEQMLGPFTEKNNPLYDVYATDLIQGDIVTLEYIEPQKTIAEAVISISEVSYNYRNMGFYFSKEKTGFGSAAYCTINVNCTEGADWQDQKRGVARIYMKLGSEYSWCSGSLVNNTKQDLTPYLLTAEHCADYNGQGAAVAPDDLHQWIFNFNYEASGCSNPSSDPYNSNSVIVGGTFKAQGNLVGNSDFYLILLDSKPSSSLNLYYNGWSRDETPSPNGAGISHPQGDIKKVHIYSSAAKNYINPFGGSVSSHWGVLWTKGMTEGGSSGSPMFNNNKLIVGQLSGGSAFNCNSSAKLDLYGKFYYSWDKSGTSATQRLKDWLDPTGSNVASFQGTYVAGSSLNAAFTANITNINVGGTVTFTDISTGSPKSWLWTFTGGNPSSSGKQSPPAVTYNTKGKFTVSLTVTNSSATDTETKTGYINVSDNTAGDCGVLNYPIAGHLYAPAKVSGGGYFSGNNKYKDKEKTNYCDSYSPFTRVEGVDFRFGVATGNNSNKISIVMRKDNGGKPGSVIGTTYISIGQIKSDITNNYYSYAEFSPPVEIPGPFYIGVILPTTAGDTIALATNDDGDTNPGTAWEQWVDGTWHNFSDTQGWSVNISLAVFPEACWGVTGIEPLAAAADFRIYPNPANNFISLHSEANNPFVRADIYNVIGSCIKSFSFPNLQNEYMLDISGINAGIYYIDIITRKSHVTKKFSIIH